MDTRVSDLSVKEFRALIQEVVKQTLEEILRDPDEGLELQADFERVLHNSLKGVPTTGETVSAESAAATLGLTW